MDKPRILIIEDDATLVSGICFSLSLEGYAPKAAGTGAEGIAQARSDGFDLILLDVMLPDMDGFAVCREIRKTSDLPIIFLTACDDEVNVVMGLKMGGDDYVTKPFKTLELISRIQAVLRRASRKPQGSKLLTSRDGYITLDPETAEVKAGENRLVLSSGEYRLLLCLMANSGMVLSRKTILDRIAEGDGMFLDDNTLFVYIRRLREKIEPDPGEPSYLKNVRGMGYRFE